MTMKAPTKRPSKKVKKIEEVEEIVSDADATNIVENNETDLKKDLPRPKPKRKKRKTKQEKIEEEIANSKLEYQGPPYVLHEIECLCFSRVQRAMAHDAHGRRFDVFSLLDEDGKVLQSTVQCEDCGRKWDVLDIDDYDLSQMDKMPTYTRKKLQRSLPSDIVHLCDELKVSTAMMSYISWIIQEKKWGTQILISNKKYRREDISFDSRILIINGPLNFKIEEIKTSDVAEFW